MTRDEEKRFRLTWPPWLQGLLSVVALLSLIATSWYSNKAAVTANATANLANEAADKASHAAIELRIQALEAKHDNDTDKAEHLAQMQFGLCLILGHLRIEGANKVCR